MNTEGAALLKDAYRKDASGLAPNESGVWKLFLEGQLMTLGKAEDGLRKRFSDLYRGKLGGTAGKKEITETNRDKVVVWWRRCSCEECGKFRDLMLKKCQEAGEELPWYGKDSSRQ